MKTQWTLCALGVCLLGLALAARTSAQTILPTYFPEARTITVRDPSQFPRAPLPAEPPPTVASPPGGREPLQLSLDDAMRIALENSRVVRRLAGTTAVASGRTIYDPAIFNAGIDKQQARFDPNLVVNNSFNRIENPVAAFDPMNPGQSVIGGTRVDNYTLDAGVTKQNALGGQWQLGVNVNRNAFRPGVFPLNPQTGTSTEMSFTQPLLQGAGIAPNLAPIVLARLDTERSYFALKDSLQELVRGTAEAYWSLVSARVDRIVRERQVNQSNFAYELARTEQEVGRKNASDVAQAATTLAQLKANLIGAKATVLTREATLRNLIGLPPGDGREIIPTSQPITTQYEPQWAALAALAEERRPDLIELKILLEADEQLLIQARNTALPQLNAVALYRWNGLEGEMPNSTDLATRPGQFTDWTMGVNFSVPVGLRASRASLRQQEINLTRDRANLQQGVHSATHNLAAALRNLDQAWQQYVAFREATVAARRNLDVQRGLFRNRTTIFLTVLSAINDWGNTVSSEALALTAYNTQFANLEFETGTILEAHGIFLYEERYGSLGPLGRLFPDVCYPQGTPPTGNSNVLEPSDKASERSFNLDIPDEYLQRVRGNELPPPNGPETPPDYTPGELPTPRRTPGPLPGTPPARPPALPLPQPEELPPRLPDGNSSSATSSRRAARASYSVAPRP